MRLITEREQVRGVAECWRKQYGPDYVGGMGNTREIQRKLDALNVETATAADVEAIIGNDWIKMRCSECGKYGMPRLEIGEPPDYESATAYLCPPCVLNAVNQLGKFKATP